MSCSACALAYSHSGQGTVEYPTTKWIQRPYVAISQVHPEVQPSGHTQLEVMSREGKASMDAE